MAFVEIRPEEIHHLARPFLKAGGVLELSLNCDCSVCLSSSCMAVQVLWSSQIKFSFWLCLGQWVLCFSKRPMWLCQSFLCNVGGPSVSCLAVYKQDLFLCCVLIETCSRIVCLLVGRVRSCTDYFCVAFLFRVCFRA